MSWYHFQSLIEPCQGDFISWALLIKSKICTSMPFEGKNIWSFASMTRIKFPIGIIEGSQFFLHTLFICHIQIYIFPSIFLVFHFSQDFFSRLNLNPCKSVACHVTLTRIVKKVSHECTKILHSVGKCFRFDINKTNFEKYRVCWRSTIKKLIQTRNQKTPHISIKHMKTQN